MYPFTHATLFVKSLPHKSKSGDLMGYVRRSMLADIASTEAQSRQKQKESSVLHLPRSPTRASSAHTCTCPAFAIIRITTTLLAPALSPNCVVWLCCCTERCRRSGKRTWWGRIGCKGTRCWCCSWRRGAVTTLTACTPVALH